MEIRQHLVRYSTWRPMPALALVMLAGFSLRIADIGRWPLWSDEALTLVIAQWPYRSLFFAAVDPTPGLYYALHKLLLDPTVGAAAARSISLVCGTLLIPATYFLARQARVPALFSAALVALSFPLIDYSQEARAYSLLTLLVTLSAASFVQWSRTGRPAALGATLAASVLAFYTHFSSVFWIGPSVLAILAIGRRQAIAPLLVTAIAAVPEVYRTLGFPSGGFIWLAQATPAQAADTLAKMLLPLRPAASWLVLAALLAGWRGWAHRSRIAAWARGNSGAAIAVGILMAVPLNAWLFGVIAKPVFMTRTILIAVPAFALAIALLLKFDHRAARFGVVAAYAVSLLVTGTSRQKEDWRGVAARIGSEPILLCEPGQVVAMRHAAGDRNRLFLLREDGVAEVVGSPWQRYLFELMSGRGMAEAIERGSKAGSGLYPVWPVWSGQIVSPSSRPVTLQQAIAICESGQDTRRSRYIPD